VTASLELDTRVTYIARSLRGRLLFDAERDADFFMRVYETPQSTYGKRVARLGFRGLGQVLDAGCGYGQWTLALAAANERVTALDVQSHRLVAGRALSRELAVSNVESAAGSLDALPFGDSSFDAVFCYGAVFFVDFRAAFAEFHRVLRRGGRLYVVLNGLGWYAHNLVRSHNPSKDFSSRRMAFDTLRASLSFYLRGRKRSGSQLVVPARTCRAALRAAGFDDVEIGAEGGLGGRETTEPAPFYRRRYLGLRGVYEATCRR
jgi:SAM-dependent methyltransferase